MVDLMMWLVIAAMMLAAAIQGIGYYQQAAYAYQAKNDVTHGHQWAAARVSLESKTPDTESMQDAMTAGDYKISNKPDIALVASQGNSYCIGVRAYNVKGDNVFYAPSSDPSNIKRAKEMPASCGTPGEAAGPDAPGADSDNDGTTNLLDEDIDNDGILNGSDPDVDGDGVLNENDKDIDGDRISNAKDDTPNGTIVGPKFFDATGGPAAIDPRVKIVGATMSGNSVNLALEIDTTGISNLTGPYYGLSWRVTCQLPNGTQYYRHGALWQQYTGKTVSPLVQNLPCSSTDSSKVIGYIAGPFNATKELTEPTSNQKGPINVISEGVLAPLFGNTVGSPTTTTFVDPRLSLRNAVLSPTGLVVGAGLDLGGAPFNVNPYYGLSNRLTCQLANGSTFYHYPTLYTSYNGNSYEAPNHTFTCPSASTSIGYVAGGDSGAPELIGRSGQKGPTNVLRGGQLDLSGNDASIAPTTQNYSDARLTVRKVELTGGVDVKIGLSINMSAMNSSGAYLGYSARLTCENITTAVKSYKVAGLYAHLTSSNHPSQVFTSSCPAGTKAVGYVVGPYLGTPVLTQSISGAGPSNVVIGGVQ
jgi:hypothetical protein